MSSLFLGKNIGHPAACTWPSFCKPALTKELLFSGIQCPFQQFDSLSSVTLCSCEENKFCSLTKEEEKTAITYASLEEVLLADPLSPGPNHFDDPIVYVRDHDACFHRLRPSEEQKKTSLSQNEKTPQKARCLNNRLGQTKLNPWLISGKAGKNIFAEQFHSRTQQQTRALISVQFHHLSPPFQPMQTNSECTRSCTYLWARIFIRKGKLKIFLNFPPSNQTLIDQISGPRGLERFWMLRLNTLC